MSGPDNSSNQSEYRDAFFERVIQVHATLLFRVAYSALRNAADAEDAVADTLLKLLRTGAWQSVNNERAFLTRAVWRSALDRVAARAPSGVAELGDAGESALLDDKPSPELRFIAGERSAVLHTFIDALPLDLREPLLLSAVEELNSREIGDVLHLPEGTVRTRLMRARTRLREQYDMHQRRCRDREVTARGPAQ